MTAPVTSLQVIRFGAVVRYDGICLGERVTVFPLGDGRWRTQIPRGATLVTGSLLEALGIAVGQKWRCPDGRRWRVGEIFPVVGRMRLDRSAAGRIRLSATADVEQFLAADWNPEPPC